MTVTTLARAITREHNTALGAGRPERRHPDVEVFVLPPRRITEHEAQDLLDGAQRVRRNRYHGLGGEPGVCVACGQPQGRTYESQPLGPEPRPLCLDPWASKARQEAAG